MRVVLFQIFVLLLALNSCGTREKVDLNNGENTTWPVALPRALSQSQQQEILNQFEQPFYLQTDDSLLWLLPAGSAPIHSSKIMRLEKTDSALILYRAQKPILKYNVRLLEPPAGVDSLFRRSGFIHPLWSPAGQILTQIHPPDHYHHLGLWHPWTRVRFGQETVDFWNLGSGSGTVRFKKLLSTVQGPVFCSFTVLQEMALRRSGRIARTLISDTLSVRAWNAGEHCFVIDYRMAQTNVSQQELVLEAYRYGGFALRANAAWQGTNRFYLTSEGKTIEDADGSRARWCLVGGHRSGSGVQILFLSHPQNLNHPEPIRIWGKDFQFTFFNFCPVKFKSWRWPQGKVLRLNYRLVIKDEAFSVEEAEDFWQAFASPPKFVFKREVQ